MSRPKISVLIPIYNGQAFLQEALDSIYNQTFQDYEIVIVDDGSTDNTANIIKNQNKSSIKYFKNDVNSGIVKTLNNGLKQCMGRYIIRMDADDISLPDRFKLQYEYMEAHPDVVLCGTSIVKFSETYSFIDIRGGEDKELRSRLVFDTTINHPSAIIRAEVIHNNALFYPENYPHAEDYAFWYTLSKYGKLSCLNEVLVKYRMHGNNVSMKFNDIQYHTMNQIRLKILTDFWKDIIGGIEWLSDFKVLIEKDKVGIEELTKMDRLLMNLIQENNRMNMYDKQTLRSSAAWYWYVVFLYENFTNYSPKLIFSFIINSNSICKYLDTKNKMKFLIKSLLSKTKK